MNNVCARILIGQCLNKRKMCMNKKDYALHEKFHLKRGKINVTLLSIFLFFFLFPYIKYLFAHCNPLQSFKYLVPWKRRNGFRTLKSYHFLF